MSGVDLPVILNGVLTGLAVLFVLCGMLTMRVLSFVDAYRSKRFFGSIRTSIGRFLDLAGFQGCRKYPLFRSGVAA
ncbi:MAG: hypothetical protein LBL59_06365 [Xanthomonadaceae bacterium]|nr:hypothetical protein [Xanthomonadaceae bacterium]